MTRAVNPTSRLLPLQTGLAAFYLVLVLLRGAIHIGPTGYPFVIMCSGTLASLLILRYLGEKSTSSLKRLESIGTVAAGFVLLNTVVYLYLASGYNETLNLVLLGTGILCFFLSSRRLILVLLVSLFLWFAVELFSYTTIAWLHYVLGLFLAAGMKLPAELRKAESQQTLEALRASEERYALAAEGSNDALWDWDLGDDKIVYSRRWAAMLGIAAEELPKGSVDWLERVHPEDRPALESAIESHLKGQTSHLSHQYRIRQQDNNFLWVLTRGVAVREESGTPYRMAGSHSDVSHQKETEKQLKHRAFHDPLTGLPNRALFLKILSRSLARQRKQPDHQFAVLFIDLDDLKLINDSLGHLAGDEVLREVATRLSETVQPPGVIARFAGDEFAVLLDDLGSLEEATDCAQEIDSVLRSPFMCAGQEIFTAASVGIVRSEGQHKTAEELLRDADTAMYQAKHGGGSSFAVFDRSMYQNAVETLKWETSVRRALEHEEFSLHYQPMFSVETREVVAVEAFLRWRHSEKGLLCPDEFLREVGNPGLLVAVGWWALRQACHDINQYWASGLLDDLRVNVNVSAPQFAKRDFTERVLEVLNESGLSAQHLGLEISGDSLRQSEGSARKKLAQLAQEGIAVWLDDFGAGSSPISDLRTLSFEGVKLDRFLTAKMELEEIRRISLALLHLSSTLGFDVAAAAVETEEQFQLLAKQGCSWAQGNYLCKPMTREALGEFLRRQRLKSIPQKPSRNAEDSADVKYPQLLEIRKAPGRNREATESRDLDAVGDYRSSRAGSVAADDV